MKQLFVVLVSMLFGCSAHAELSSYLERKALMDDLAKRVVAQDFDSVHDTVEEFLKGGQRNAEGRWKLSIAFSGVAAGMAELVGGTVEWDALEKRLRVFAEERPKSQIAWLLYAQAQNAKAWKVRGTGFSSTTTAEGRAQYRTHLTSAREALERHKKQLARNPQWYAERIQVGNYLGEPKDKLVKLLKEGVARQPLYYNTYFSALFAFAPRWGGSHAEMVAFINEFGARSASPEGKTLYSRMVWSAFEESEYQVIFSPALDWQVMEQSMRDTLRLYPDDWNSQASLLLACMNADMALVRRLVQYVRQPASPALLGRNLGLFEDCRDLALGRAQPFIMRDRKNGREVLME